MIDFTPIFLSDITSGIEVEGFWVMFSSNPPFQNPNVPLSDLDNSGWDNRNSLLPTNTIFHKGNIESSVYPNDIYKLDATALSIAQIRSWYLVYRLPMLRDSVGNYRIACSMSTNDVPLSNFWYVQNVIRARINDRALFYPIRVDGDADSHQILRRRFIEDSDISLSNDKLQLEELAVGSVPNGLFDRNKCIIIH